MKKTGFILTLLLLFSSFGTVFAQDFDNISDLTQDQKDKLAEIQANYKKEYNTNESKIMEYTNKLNQIKTETDKTPEQITILTGAYERNLIAIKASQQQLKQKTEELYKSVLTETQYKQYQLQQNQVENAFSEFLKK